MTCDLLQHMSCVCQARKLSISCGNRASSALPVHVMSSFVHEPQTGQFRSLSHRAALVTKLVVESLMPHERSYVEWDRDSALHQVKQAVYATQPADTCLVDLLYSVSVEQAFMVKEICTAILQHTLKLNNCFETLESGLQAGTLSLVDTALDMACTNYSQAVLQDHTGWIALSQKGVLLVLRSNKLQIDSEREVLDALALWVNARPEERTSLFTDMFVQAVRLHEMTYTEVQLVDSHPLVSRHQKAYMHVAHALLAWHIQKPVLHSCSSSRARPLLHMQPTHQQPVDLIPDLVQRAPVLQTAADSHVFLSIQEQGAAGCSVQSCGAQPSRYSGNTQHQAEMYDLPGSGSQSTPPLQVSHQGPLHQPAQRGCGSQQSQHCDSDAEVELSCSVDDPMLGELELECSAVSQLRPAAVNRAALSPGQVTQGEARSNADLPIIAYPLLTVKTGQVQKAGQRASLSLEQAMAVSPSAQPAKKKQATTDSMRCLKF